MAVRSLIPNPLTLSPTKPVVNPLPDIKPGVVNPLPNVVVANPLPNPPLTRHPGVINPLPEAVIATAKHPGLVNPLPDGILSKGLAEAIQKPPIGVNPVANAPLAEIIKRATIAER